MAGEPGCVRVCTVQYAKYRSITSVASGKARGAGEGVIAGASSGVQRATDDQELEDAVGLKIGNVRGWVSLT